MSSQEGGGLRTDSSAVKRIKKKAELPKSFRIFHGLRHHLAVTLANSGEYTIDMIGELLTQKSAAMTKRYVKYLPDTTKKAANRAADLLQDHMAKKSFQSGILWMCSLFIIITYM